MKRWLFWSGIFLGLTLLYLPSTIGRSQFLRTPEEYAACDENPYCTRIGSFKFLLSSSDTRTYLEPAYRLLTQGAYQPDARLPGYGALYWGLLKVGLSPKASLWGLFVISLGLWVAVVGSWLQALERAGVAPQWLLIGAALLAFSPFSYYTRVLIPDIPAAAAGLLGLYALTRERYFLAGAALTWAFFLRPVLGVWLPTAGVFLLLRKAKLSALLIFSLPFALAEGSWTFRNWQVYRDFRPLVGTAYLLDPGMYHDITYDAYRLLTVLGRNTNLSWNDPQHPYGLLLCTGDTLQPLEVWRRAFAPLAGCASCPPETLFTIGADLCRLLTSPTYTIGRKDFRGPAPTSADCTLEVELSQKLRRCTEAAQTHLGTLRPLLAVGYQLWDMRWVPTAGRPTSLFRQGYFLAFYLLLGGLALLSFYRFWHGKGEFRLATTFGWLPILAYFVLGVVERRYLDLQLPFFFVAVGLSEAQRR